MRLENAKGQRGRALIVSPIYGHYFKKNSYSCFMIYPSISWLWNFVKLANCPFKGRAYLLYIFFLELFYLLFALVFVNLSRHITDGVSFRVYVYVYEICRKMVIYIKFTILLSLHKRFYTKHVERLYDRHNKKMTRLSWHSWWEYQVIS